MTRELKPCGTPAAYSRHLRHGEDPCDACKAAEAGRSAAYRAEVRRILHRAEARRRNRQDQRLAPRRRAVLAEAVGHGSYGGIAGGS